MNGFDVYPAIDVRDGRALCAPAYEPVAKFPVKVESGGIFTRDNRD